MTWKKSGDFTEEMLLVGLQGITISSLPAWSGHLVPGTGCQVWPCRGIWRILLSLFYQNTGWGMHLRRICLRSKGICLSLDSAGSHWRAGACGTTVKQRTAGRLLLCAARNSRANGKSDTSEGKTSKMPEERGKEARKAPRILRKRWFWSSSK